MQLFMNFNNPNISCFPTLCVCYVIELQFPSPPAPRKKKQSINFMIGRNENKVASLTFFFFISYSIPSTSKSINIGWKWRRKYLCFVCYYFILLSFPSYFLYKCFINYKKINSRKIKSKRSFFFRFQETFYSIVRKYWL